MHAFLIQEPCSPQLNKLQSQTLWFPSDSSLLCSQQHLGFNKKTLCSACTAAGAAAHSWQVPDSDSREPGVPPSHFLVEYYDAHGTATLALLYKVSGQALTTTCKYKVGFGWVKGSKLLQPSRTQIRGRRVPSYLP